MISIVCPTRGRPQNAEKVWESWKKFSDNSRLCFLVDDDDPQMPVYEKMAVEGNWNMAFGPRIKVGPMLNRYFDKYQNEEFYCFVGDDHRFESDWEHMAQKGTIAYGDDGFQHEALPTASVIDGDILRALGYWVLPGLTHLYFDNFWKTLGEDTGTLRYHPEVKITHYHPHAGKGETDAQYEEVNSPEMHAKDQAVYSQWVENRASDVQKVSEALRDE